MNMPLNRSAIKIHFQGIRLPRRMNSKPIREAQIGIAIHELGHALVTKLTNGKVRKVYGKNRLTITTLKFKTLKDYLNNIAVYLAGSASAKAYYLDALHQKLDPEMAKEMAKRVEETALHLGFAGDKENIGKDLQYLLKRYQEGSPLNAKKDRNFFKNGSFLKMPETELFQQILTEGFNRMALLAEEVPLSAWRQMAEDFIRRKNSALLSDQAVDSFFKTHLGADYKTNRRFQKHLDRFNKWISSLKP